MRNLFAFRTPHPKELRKAEDPVGPLNLEVLERGIAFGLRVAAWGQLSPKWLRRLAQRSIGSIKIRAVTHVLGLTERGYDRSSHLSDLMTRQPRHPLYIKNATRAVPWQPGQCS